MVSEQMHVISFSLLIRPAPVLPGYAWEQTLSARSLGLYARLGSNKPTPGDRLHWLLASRLSRQVNRLPLKGTIIWLFISSH